ncbi:MAG: ribonuclease HII [Candidatus Hodarchaeales archaeon]|jgi:ribonuclease HII
MAICYVDEVGCASIAGPVLVCAVAVDSSDKIIDGIKDSKQLSRIRREKLYDPIASRLKHSFATSSVQTIKDINIHWAKLKAMREAVYELIDKQVNIVKVIVDGKFEIPNLNIKQEAIIKADSKLWQVGAASILAKVKRDNMMARLAREAKYSYYDWESNAGYYSPNHMRGIVLYGPCDIHRRNFVYFKYCMDRHNEFKRLAGDSKVYFEYMANREIKYGMSDYAIWKTSLKNME